MPCYDDRSCDQNETERRMKVDRLTRYLCALLTVAETASPASIADDMIHHAEQADGINPGELAAWWQDHKAHDAKREGGDE